MSYEVYKRDNVIGEHIIAIRHQLGEAIFIFMDEVRTFYIAGGYTVNFVYLNDTITALFSTIPEADTVLIGFRPRKEK